MRTDFLKSRLLAVVIVLLCVGSPQSAYAQFGMQCDVCGKLSAIRDAINDRARDVIQAIKASTKAITTEQANAAGVVAESQAAVENESSRQTNYRTYYDHPDPCGVTAAAEGGALGRAGRAYISGGGGFGARGDSGGGRTPPSGISNNMMRSLDIAANRVGAPSAEVVAGLAVSGACTTFVPGDGSRGAACVAAGAAASATSGLPNADIKAETIFDGPQKSNKRAEQKRRLTIDDAPSADATAVEAFIRNLDTPLEFEQLSQSELKTDAGRQFMLLKDAYMARLNLSLKPARDRGASMVAMPSLKPIVDQLLLSDASKRYVETYLADNVPQWRNKGISLQEYLNLEAERRSLNKDWHVSMAAAGTDAHVKEQTAMLAHQVFLSTKLLEQIDRLLLIQGMQAAASVRTEMLQPMAVLHSTAKQRK